MKDFYIENYKTVMKEIKEDTNKWKDILCFWVEKLNIVKMPTLHKTICNFIVVPIKIHVTFFYRNRKSNFKIRMNQKELQITKSVSKVFAVM